MNKDLRVTLFSNSAPVFYTANGKAYCDYLPDEENYVTNLEPDHHHLDPAGQRGHLRRPQL